MFYVYQYKDPETLIPFYVGKGCGNRADRHMKYIANGSHQNKYFANVVKSIWDSNLQPIVEIVKDGLGEQEAYDLEHAMIKVLGRRLYEEDGVLTNLTLGGAGPIGMKQTAAANAKRSASLSGQAKTEEAKQNMRKPKMTAHRAAISSARSWDYQLTNPSGEVFVTDSLKLFCENNGLKLYTLKNASKHGQLINRGHAQGWRVIPLVHQ